MSYQRIDRWQDRGGADAVLRLFAAKRIRPAVTYFEACKVAGVSRRAAEDALRRAGLRIPGRRKPTNRAPHAAPAGTKWCGYEAHFAPVEEFSRNQTNPSGLQSWCNPCRSLYVNRRSASQRSRERNAA